MSEVLLFSGGLDSLITWYATGKPKAIYVQIGHRYQLRELQTVQRLPVPVQIVSGPNLSPFEQGDGHIPYRNLHLASTGALYGDTVYFGALRGETSRDKSRRFYRDASKLLSYLEPGDTHIVAPLRHLTKTEIVARFLEAGGNPVHLQMTRSCYDPYVSPDYTGCGMCMACFRRWTAMTLNGIDEVYENDPALFAPLRPGNWRSWLRKLVRCEPIEWPGIIENNWQAARAVGMARQKMGDR